MELMSATEAAEKWSITRRRVQLLCSQNRIDGAQRIGNMWVIPSTGERPDDARKKVTATDKNFTQSIAIERFWAMPNKNTFEIKPINALITDEMNDGLWIDPFANRNKLAHVTNDLNLEFDTDYHLDALDFLKMFDDNSVDGVLYDPPYSPRQVSECYKNVGLNVTWDTTKASFWSNHKKEISRIVKKDGKVITFGWNSGGIGMKYGFHISRILIVPHGGWHNDTICTVEIKMEDYKRKIENLNMKNENEQKPTKSYTEQDESLKQTLTNLPEAFWNFKNEDTREYTHGIHSYPAMMVCPISRNIIKIVKQIMPINSLLDPFAGSGTVLVEGILAGISSVNGSDINPLALFLSKVKTKLIDINELQLCAVQLYNTLENQYSKYKTVINNIDSFMQNELQLDLISKDRWGSNAPTYMQEFYTENNLDMDIPDFKNIGYWFRPKVILELSTIKKAVQQFNDKDIKEFIFIAFSETIRLVSNRRNGEFKMFRMPIAKVEKHNPDVKKEFFKILNRNIEKMNDYAEACNDLYDMPKVTIYSDNACELNNIPNNSIDLVVTSPPYGDSRTTVAYGEFSRLSLQWLDMFEITEKEIMGIDRSLMGGIKFRNGFEYSIPSTTLKNSLEKIAELDLERAGDVFSFYQDLDKSLSAIASKTKTDCYQFWVVGNRTVKGELLLTDQIISELAESHGLNHICTVGRSILNKVMPSLNSPTNESGNKSATMTNEHIVILKKI
jgi:DNA modification methylase